MILYVLTQSSKVQLFLWAVSSLPPSTTSPSKNLNARCGLWLQHQKQLQNRISLLSIITNTSWTLSLLHSQRGLPYGKCFCLMLIQKKTLWFSAPLVQETSDLHLPDYVTALTSTSSWQSYTRIFKPESWTCIEICMPAICKTSWLK